MVSIKVIDDEEYEKNKTFYVEIGEPRLVEMSEKKGEKDRLCGAEPYLYAPDLITHGCLAHSHSWSLKNTHSIIYVKGQRAESLATEAVARMS